MQTFALQQTSIALRASSRAAPRIGARKATVAVRAFKVDEEELKATSAEALDSINSTATEYAEKIAAAWEASEEKPTIIGAGVGGILALYFIDGIVSAVDRIPLISTVFELIGLSYTAWTVYRIFAVEGEKDKLVGSVKGFVSKVGINL